ncbi:unnamed protein product [Phytomonas sp. EM1]|nr:unnamed protein product [Phytomonas sp. EM1]|eukprot:CCW63966.1 unnamed protein product [Phytomonas sp. isolate EM1]
MGLFNNLNHGMPLRGIHHRPSILIVFTICFLLLLQSQSSVFAIHVVEGDGVGGPDGAYCVKYGNHLVESRITFHTASGVLDFYLFEFGEVTNCPAVAYTYDPVNRVVDVPDVRNGTTCMGKQAERNHAKVKVVFVPEKDALNVKVNGLETVMNKCA